MSQSENIPRMRTAAGIVAELRKLDPDTSVTESLVRRLAKSGAVPVTWVGSKALINLNDVLDLFRAGAEKEEPEPPAVGGIRRLDASIRPPVVTSGARRGGGNLTRYVKEG